MGKFIIVAILVGVSVGALAALEVSKSKGPNCLETDSRKIFVVAEFNQALASIVVANGGAGELQDTVSAEAWENNVTVMNRLADYITQPSACFGMSRGEAQGFLLVGGAMIDYIQRHNLAQITQERLSHIKTLSSGDSEAFMNKIVARATQKE